MSFKARKSKKFISRILFAVPFLTFITIFLTAHASATTTSGAVKLNAEIATAIAMKIASPNDANPNCTPSDLNGDGVIDENDTYGVVNRYATSNGAEGSKMVDT
ncbi:hypothetical protein IJH02_01550, partial [Candidatus Saccharibacteria bacterium]|nr:hypothetical protein [Candidatus Saccharibacteria bacterium]